MNQTREILRVAFPHLGEDELEKLQERIRRYVHLAVEIADATLTTPSTGATVNVGQVDPSTSKNTG